MDGPTRIGDIIDEAMRELLTPEGFDLYLTLMDQTRRNREAITADVRGRYRELLDAETERRLEQSPTLSPALLEVDARMRVEEVIQREIGRRISEEEQQFKQRVDTLFHWVDQRRKAGCEGCGWRTAARVCLSDRSLVPLSGMGRSRRSVRTGR